jgi:hypothetical protein
MSFVRLLLFFVLTVAARAELAPIADAARDPVWRGLFSTLSTEKPRQSTFEEHRYFPFHKKPVVLTGELRLLPNRGLSLNYLTPKPYTLVVDLKGLLIRDAKGHDQVVPDDPHMSAAMAATVNILHFNLPELEKSFELRGERTGDAWTLMFVPRNEGLANALGTLTVQGEASRVGKIVIAHSPKQRIEILISATREDVAFTDAELARYFR